jgi:hypothetical protein
MLELLFNFSIKLLGKLLPISIRWHYTPERIAEKIKVTIASESNGVEFWAGNLPHVQTWVVVTNLSAFPVELERAFGSVTFGAPICDFVCLRRIAIPAASQERFMINVHLSTLQVDYVRKALNSTDKVSFDFQAHFLCEVNNFYLRRYLDTTHFKTWNFPKSVEIST